MLHVSCCTFCPPPIKAQDTTIFQRRSRAVGWTAKYAADWSPKGPFRTKNATAPESVVFCHRRSFSLSVPFSCLFSLEKRGLLSALRSVLPSSVANLLPVVKSLSVAFLVRKVLVGKDCNIFKIFSCIRGPRMGGWICSGWNSCVWGAPNFSPEVPKCLF